MKNNLSNFTLRVPQILLDKLAFVASYEGRSKNKEIEQLIKKRIAEFEAAHGEITKEDLEKLFNNDMV
jgi:hypothetical protein